MNFKQHYIENFESLDLPIYFHPAWLEIVTKGKWDINCIINEQGQFQAIWVYFKKSKLGINYVLPMQYTPYGGFWFWHAVDTKHENRKINEKNWISKLLENVSIDYWSCLSYPGCDFTYPAMLNEINVRQRFTYEIDTTIPYTEIKEKYNSKLKKHLENFNEKCKIIESDDIEILISLHKKAYQNKEPFNTKILRKIFEQFNLTNCLILEAVEEEETVASLFFIHDSRRMLYLAGGHSNKGNYHSSGLLDKAIQIACEKQIPVFDFHGSRQPNIERFFRQFFPTIRYFQQLEKTNTKKGKLVEISTKK